MDSAGKHRGMLLLAHVSVLLVMYFKKSNVDKPN